MKGLGILFGIAVGAMLVSAWVLIVGTYQLGPLPMMVWPFYLVPFAFAWLAVMVWRESR